VLSVVIAYEVVRRVNAVGEQKRVAAQLARGQQVSDRAAAAT
jgi:hypothetical protein